MLVGALYELTTDVLLWEIIDTGAYLAREGDTLLVLKLPPTSSGEPEVLTSSGRRMMIGSSASNGSLRRAR